MNIDAAWTDVFLASASLIGAAFAYRHDRTRWLTAAGLAVLGAAATAGVFRFSGFDAVIPYHDRLSSLAGLVGLPLAAAGVAVVRLEAETTRRVQVIASIAVVWLTAAALFLDPDLARSLRTVVSGACMVAAIGFSAKDRIPAGVIGPVLVLVAGLGIAGDGELAGFHRMGWFHLVMAVAAGLLAFAATQTRSPAEVDGP